MKKLLLILLLICVSTQFGFPQINGEIEKLYVGTWRVDDVHSTLYGKTTKVFVLVISKGKSGFLFGFKKRTYFSDSGENPNAMTYDDLKYYTGFIKNNTLFVSFNSVEVPCTIDDKNILYAPDEDQNIIKYKKVK